MGCNLRLFPNTSQKLGEYTYQRIIIQRKKKGLESIGNYNLCLTTNSSRERSSCPIMKQIKFSEKKIQYITYYIEVGWFSWAYFVLLLVGGPNWWKHFMGQAHSTL